MRPVHIKINGIKSSKLNFSLKTNIPKKSPIVGEIYCKNPTTFNGSFLVPSAYRSNGNAVNTPLKAIKNQKLIGKFPETPAPRASVNIRQAKDGIPITKVSKASPLRESNFDFFLRSPYIANEIARATDIAGNLPYIHVFITTPIAAKVIPNFCNIVSLSLKKILPKKVKTRGFI
jgi:hypothetical protein